MPLETNGWIEYTPYLTLEERSEEYSWLTFMSVDSIVDQIDEATEFLFGYSKRIIRQEFETESIAKDRGIPTNASELVKREIERVEKYEETFGSTFIYYDEIRKVEQLIPANSPWKKLFDQIELFKMIKRLEDDQIRLVVWFDW